MVLILLLPRRIETTLKVALEVKHVLAREVTLDTMSG